MGTPATNATPNSLGIHVVNPSQLREVPMCHSGCDVDSDQEVCTHITSSVTTSLTTTTTTDSGTVTVERVVSRLESRDSGELLLFEETDCGGGGGC